MHTGSFKRCFDQNSRSDRGVMRLVDGQSRVKSPICKEIVVACGKAVLIRHKQWRFKPEHVEKPLVWPAGKFVFVVLLAILFQPLLRGFLVVQAVSLRPRPSRHPILALSSRFQTKCSWVKPARIPFKGGGLRVHYWITRPSKKAGNKPWTDFRGSKQERDRFRCTNTKQKRNNHHEKCRVHSFGTRRKVWQGTSGKSSDPRED